MRPLPTSSARLRKPCERRSRRRSRARVPAPRDWSRGSSSARSRRRTGAIENCEAALLRRRQLRERGHRHQVFAVQQVRLLGPREIRLLAPDGRPRSGDRRTLPHELRHRSAGRRQRLRRRRPQLRKARLERLMQCGERVRIERAVDDRNGPMLERRSWRGQSAHPPSEPCLHRLLPLARELHPGLDRVGIGSRHDGDRAIGRGECCRRCVPRRQC